MTFLETICNELEQADIQYALVGGYAVALHGAIRGTIDIDFIIRWDKTMLIKTEQALNNLGLISRLPISAVEIFDFKQEYINNRNLVAWNFYNPNDLSQQVDIVITYPLKKSATKAIKLNNTSVKLLKIAELIKMKQESGREQDLEDIAALKKLSS